MKKIEIKNKIFEFILRKPRTWTDINDSFNISKGSMSNYLREWIDKGWVKKEIINNEVHYSAMKLEIPQKIMFTRVLKENLKNLTKLRKLGLFSKGMTDKGLLEFLNKDKNKDLTYIDFLRFMQEESLTSLRDFFKSKLKIKIKIEENPENLIKELQNILKSI